MDESHREFVVDNDTRETYESWEACLAEGVRSRQVTEEVPSRIQDLHEKSLTAGRDVLEEADPDEKRKWLTKEGEDWSGAFGHDPKAYMDSTGKRKAQPGAEAPVHDPYNPSSDDDVSDTDQDSDDEDVNGKSTAATSSFITTDADHPNAAKQSTGANEGNDEKNPDGQKGVNAANKHTEKRKHRGLMQWKPVRNIQFAKNEAKFAIRRATKKMTSLEGRQPDVETETGT